MTKVVGPIMGLFFQSAAQGALPQLFAATDPSVKGGDYFGPDGFQELRGHPKLTKMASQAHNQADIDKLWEVSEELAGLQFKI